MQTSTLDKNVRDMIRTEAVGGTMQDMISYGVPELGWKGDPWLTLVWRKLESRWEIWDQQNEFKPSCVYRSRQFTGADELPDIFQVVQHMVLHDFRNRGIDEQLADIDAHNAAVEREKDRVATERTAAMLEKVYWGLSRDLGEGRTVH